MQAVEFGKRLRDLRKKRDLTIRQVETYSGVSNSYLSQLENGKRGIPSPDILQKLAPVLKVPYKSLMDLAGYFPEEKTQGNDLPKLPPKAEKIIDSLARANSLDDDDYDIIADQVERLIAYAEKKKSSPKNPGK